MSDVERSLTEGKDETRWRERAVPCGTRFLILSPDDSTSRPNDLSDPVAVKSDFEAVCRAERYAQPEGLSQERATHLSLMRRHGLAEKVPGTEDGFLTYLPKGLVMLDLVTEFVRTKHGDSGRVSEVRTPSLLLTEHPALEAYLQRFPAGQFRVGEEAFMPFAACFGQFLLLSREEIKGSQLPLGYLEIVRAYRREKLDTLRGLERLQSFTMPDCHTLCLNMDQAIGQVLKQFTLCQETMAVLELKPQMVIRATEEFFEENRALFSTLADFHGQPILLELWKESPAYFCFKLELHCLDASGKRNIALSTVQIDPENSERFAITYTDEHGQKQNPIIIHTSISGSLERVLWAELEKLGKEIDMGDIPEWPYWLAPVQVRLIPSTSDYIESCEQLAKILPARVEIDDTDLKINKRVKSAAQAWVPFTVIYGQKEAEGDGTLSVRDRKGEVKAFTVGQLAQRLKELQGNKPFLATKWPPRLSRQSSIE